MSTNPLKALSELGQSIWFDYIRRDMVHDGTLDRLIQDDGITGMTTNPSIFSAAIGKSSLYDDDIRAGQKAKLSPLQIFEKLAIADVQAACDKFRPVYDRTKTTDGYVSIEVSPTLAHDTQATLDEARRLFKAVDRPNVMIKIPGTEAGAPAIEQALYEGINVNITLLFSLAAYDRVMDAWFNAMERRQAEGKPLEGIASVASFFVSRVDGLVDTKLQAILAASPDVVTAKLAQRCLHKAAIANAKLAYKAFEERFRGKQFKPLGKAGAQVQRPLWASTSTKDPKLSDVLYVETLIGKDTVNTLPPNTVDAYRDHGEPAMRVRDDLDAAAQCLSDIDKLGVDFSAVTTALEVDGVQKFAQAFEELLTAISQKAGSMKA